MHKNINMSKYVRVTKQMKTFESKQKSFEILVNV